MSVLDTHPPLSTLIPLEFTLRDPEVGQAIFYLGNLEQTFELELTNNGNTEVTLDRLALRFRPGLLASATDIAPGSESDGWTVEAWVVEVGQRDEGSVVVELQRDPTTELAPNESVTLSLLGLRANLQWGAGQSSIVLEYTLRLPDRTTHSGVRTHPVAVLHMTQSSLHRELEDLKKRLAAPAVADPLVTDLGGRVQALESELRELQNTMRNLVDSVEELEELGSLPLTVDVAGPAAVFADGATDCELELRIQNTSEAALRLEGSDHEAPITIQFDEWDETLRPWGLVEPENLGGIQLTPPTNWTPVRRDDEEHSLYFALTPPSNLKTLQAGEFLDLKFTGVTGARSVGRGYVVVDFQGIGEARQHGSQRVVVDRSPLRASDGLVATAASEVALDGPLSVSGDTRLSGELQVGSQLETAVCLGDREVKFKAEAEGESHFSLFNNQSSLHIQNTHEEGALGYRPRGDLMTIASGGNVGIGVPAPAAKLHVGEGAARFDGGIDVPGPSHIGPIKVSDSDNVGIGTPEPHAWPRLHVKATAIRGDICEAARFEARNGFLSFGQTTDQAVGQAIYSSKTVPDGSGGHYEHNDLLLNPSGGKVGIGTATPSAELHVAGDARVTGATSLGELAVRRGSTVSGVPVIDFKPLVLQWGPGRESKERAAGVGRDALKGAVEFPGQVLRAFASVTGFSINFVDDGRATNGLIVDIKRVTVVGSRVDVEVDFGMTDNTQNWDDNLRGWSFVKVLVVAHLNAAV